MNPSLDYNLDNLQLKGDSLKRVKEAFKTSLERHLIVLERNYPVKYPNILFLINSNPNISGHALVNKSRSVFINNGYIDYSLPSGFDIEGVLCASKKR